MDAGQLRRRLRGPGPGDGDAPARLLTAARGRSGTDRRRTPALIALTLGVFLVTLNVTVVVVSLPALQRSLHAAPDQLEWVIDAYNLTGAALLLSAGSLADRFGRRRILVTGYVLFCGGAVLCALAPTAGWLIGFRVVQAIGGTALTPTSLAIVANLYPEPRERARAIGIWGISSGVGTGLGPIVGGGMTDWLGWRSVFLANAAVGLAAMAAVLVVVPRSRAAVARRLDPSGQLLAAAALAILTYALIEAQRYGWSSSRIDGLLAVDAALTAAFVVVELRTREPLIELRLFRDRQFSGAVAITVATFFTFSGFVFLNALYLQQARGYSPLAAGLLTLPAALPTLAGGPIAGHLVGTRGARGVLTAGTAVMALGVGSLALLPAGVGLDWLLAAFLLLGIGYAVINAPISTVAVASMPRDQAGVAAAVASSGRNVGLVMGIAVLGSIVNARMPGLLARRPFAEAFTSAVHSAYWVAAAISLAASAVAWTTLRATPPGS
ncbi:MAG TPA: MFS transporter [Gaiellales bacterium]|nr:MFS transporter [Gaiellales bacterium]